ncbi:hypothetical protein L7F22_027652 [Adiantum nelumboides]|nr:hypothetical protein [Adiantum nelumboides]
MLETENKSDATQLRPTSWVVLNGAEFGEDTVELVEIVEKVEDLREEETFREQCDTTKITTGRLTINSNPLLLVDKFGEHNDGLEAALDEGLLTNGLHMYRGLLDWPRAPGCPSNGIDGIVGDFFGLEDRPIERKKFDMASCLLVPVQSLRARK